MPALRAWFATLALALVSLCSWASPARAAPAWVWPLDGPHVVSRPFAPGPTPYSPGHRGADLPALPGAAVRAAGAGRVSYAGLLAGRGVVVVLHGALRTTYEPMTGVVGVGAAVAAGQQIGTLDVGHEGCPAPACLHWGLRRGEVYLDPVRLVEGGPVRLLPRDGSAGAPAAGRQAASAAPEGLGTTGRTGAPDGDVAETGGSPGSAALVDDTGASGGGPATAPGSAVGAGAGYAAVPLADEGRSAADEGRSAADDERKVAAGRPPVGPISGRDRQLPSPVAAASAIALAGAAGVVRRRRCRPRRREPPRRR